MTIEPYNYNDEPSGRSETLVHALEKCERLEKQLKIAVEALKEYADISNWDIDTFCGDFGVAEEALEQIKELEK